MDRENARYKGLVFVVRSPFTRIAANSSKFGSWKKVDYLIGIQGSSKFCGDSSTRLYAEWVWLRFKTVYENGIA